MRDAPRRPSAPLAATLGWAVLVACGCSSLGSDLPSDPPPLFDMEEPAAHLAEPDDEAARAALPLGGYTGVYVEDAVFEEGGLDEDDFGDDELGEWDEGGGAGYGSARGAGVLVRKVTENSPGDAAGIEPGDLLLSVRVDGGAPQPLSYASEWRGVEDSAAAGARLRLVLDRANAERELTLVAAARARPGPRARSERFREEQRVGVVVRTATEVEARAADLPAGAGAVVVGLTRTSPWRQAGIRFGDLVSAVEGKTVSHPQVLLDALRENRGTDTIDVTVVREGTAKSGPLPLTRRARNVRNVSVPLLWSYGRERGECETSVLGGLVRQRTTRAAWEWRFLWLFSISGGDADRLEEQQ